MEPPLWAWCLLPSPVFSFWRLSSAPLPVPRPLGQRRVSRQTSLPTGSCSTPRGLSLRSVRLLRRMVWRWGPRPDGQSWVHSTLHDPQARSPA